MVIRSFTTLLLLVALQAPTVAQVVIDGGGRFETLLGVRIGQHGVVFEVLGQGWPCTSKDDFHVERFGEEPVRLVLIRGRDVFPVCRRIPTVRQRIRFSYEELGLELGDRLVVINPVWVNDIRRDPAEFRGRSPGDRR